MCIQLAYTGHTLPCRLTRWWRTLSDVCSVSPCDVKQGKSSPTKKLPKRKCRPRSPNHRLWAAWSYPGYKVPGSIWSGHGFNIRAYMHWTQIRWNLSVAYVIHQYVGQCNTYEATWHVKFSSMGFCPFYGSLKQPRPGVRTRAESWF